MEEDLNYTMINTIKIVDESPQCTLGETPIYCDWLEKLIWVDILENRMYLMALESFNIQTVHFPFLVSAVLPTTQKGMFLLVSQEGILGYDLLQEKIVKKWMDYPESETRPNEAQISNNGDLFFGTMDFNVEKNIGSWYRLTSKTLELTKLESNVSIPNTLAFIDDQVIFGDTATQQLYRGKQNASNWKNKIAITPKIEGGGMDGSYFTEEQILINARWGHNKATVFNTLESMSIVEEIKLPVNQPTSCVIANYKNENLLFFTSAKKGLLRPSVNDGKIVVCKTNYTTRPINRFYV